MGSLVIVGTPPSAVRRAKLDFFSRHSLEVAPSFKNHKAGLVGPAFPLWNWFVVLFRPASQNV